MFFWIFMLICNLLIPLGMILFGSQFLNEKITDINSIYGYRTAMSKKNIDTWRFAHRYSGRIWHSWGRILLPFTVISMLPLIGRDNDTVGKWGAVICVILCTAMSMVIPLTESALRKHFDKDGNSLDLGLKRGSVRLQPHRDNWDALAAETIELLRSLLGSDAEDIRHVGSTAVRGIYAKPIIDIAVAAESLDAVRAHDGELQAAGIVFRGEDRPGQLLYVMGDIDADTRTHHIHVVPAGSDAWNSYVSFTDYLNAHPEDARRYSDMKRQLAAKYPEDRKSYTEAKAGKIAEILKKAGDAPRPE